MITQGVLAELPKIELHLHLEGAIPLPTLLSLVRKYEPDTKMTLEMLRERFQYSSFPEFLQTWGWKNGYLREYEDFTLFSEAVARDLADLHTHRFPKTRSGNRSLDPGHPDGPGSTPGPNRDSSDTGSLS